LGVELRRRCNQTARAVNNKITRASSSRRSVDSKRVRNGQLGLVAVNSSDAEHSGSNGGILVDSHGRRDGSKHGSNVVHVVDVDCEIHKPVHARHARVHSGNAQPIRSCRLVVEAGRPNRHLTRLGINLEAAIAVARDNLVRKVVRHGGRARRCRARRASGWSRANNRSVFVVAAVVANSLWAIRERCFGSPATNVVPLDGARALAKVRARQSAATAESKLATHHPSVLHVPVVVANSAPAAAGKHFNPAAVLVGSSNKTNNSGWGRRSGGNSAAGRTRKSKQRRKDRRSWRRRFANGSRRCRRALENVNPDVELKLARACSCTRALDGNHWSTSAGNVRNAKHLDHVGRNVAVHVVVGTRSLRRRRRVHVDGSTARGGDSNLKGCSVDNLARRAKVLKVAILHVGGNLTSCFKRRSRFARRRRNLRHNVLDCVKVLDEVHVSRGRRHVVELRSAEIVAHAHRNDRDAHLLEKVGFWSRGITAVACTIRQHNQHARNAVASIANSGGRLAVGKARHELGSHSLKTF
jgi:hypothetical protein